MIGLKKTLHTSIIQETELLLSDLREHSLSISKSYSCALLSFSLYEILEDEKYLMECNNHVLNILQKYSMGSFVVSIELVGIAFLGQILLSEGFTIDAEQLKKIDERLFREASNQLTQQNDSLVPTLNYFSESKDNKLHIFFVEELSNQIVNTIKNDRLGSRMIYTGEVDLTFPFGMIGMLLSLLKIHAKNSSKSMLESTIDGGIDFILNYKNEVDFSENLFNFFPNKILNEGKNPIFSAQMSLSLGDLGKALLLYQYVKIINNRDIIKMTNFVGLNTLLRKVETQHYVKNTSLLSGSSGVALMYHKMYQFTQLEAYREGMDFWIDKTHEMVNEKSQSLRSPNVIRNIFEDIISSKLALLSCQSPKSLSWEKIYGLSM